MDNTKKDSPKLSNEVVIIGSTAVVIHKGRNNANVEILFDSNALPALHNQYTSISVYIDVFGYANVLGRNRVTNKVEYVNRFVTSADPVDEVHFVGRNRFDLRKSNLAIIDSREMLLKSELFRMYNESLPNI